MRESPEFCRAFNDAFLNSSREKERCRAFSVRASLWFRRRKPKLKLRSSNLNPARDTEDMCSLERDVYDLWHRCLHATVSQDEETLDEKAQDDWPSLRRKIAQELEDLDLPDIAKASQILALAQSLVAACFSAAETAAEKHAEMETVRAELRLALAGAERLPEGANLLSAVGRCDDLALLSDAAQRALGLPELLQAANAARDAFEVAAHRETEIRFDRSASRAALREAYDACTAAEAVMHGQTAAAVTAIARVLSCFETEGPADPPCGEPVPAPSDTTSEPASREAEPHKPEAPNSPLPEPTQNIQPDGESENGVAAGKDTATGTSVPPDDRTKETMPVAPEPAAEAPEMEGAEAGIQRFIEELSERTSVEIPGLAPSVITGITSAVVVWTGQNTLDDLLAHYLDAGDSALAWHLATLAEERGHRPSIPSTALRALAVQSAIVGPSDYATQTISEYLAAAMGAVETARRDASSNVYLVESIAFAALLRPALLARDTNAREHLTNLVPGSDILTAYSRLSSRLTDLSYELQPSIADLAELVGVERKRRLPDVTREMRAWLIGARAAQSMHAPSNIILHDLLGPTGKIGTVLEAALRKDDAAVEACSAFLLSLIADRSIAERLVQELEREYNRPRRDAIRGMALEWLCRKLREGADLALQWRSAWHDDRIADTRHKDQLQRHISGLRKELEQFPRDDGDGMGLDGAARRCIGRAADDLLAIINGQNTTTAASPLADALDGPLLRMPAGCQPYAPPLPAYDTERSQQRETLFAFLKSPDSVAVNEVDALQRHIRDKAVLPARALLARIEQSGRLPPADLQELRQQLDEALREAAEQAQQTMIALRQELEPLQSIDLSTSHEVQRWLDRLTAATTALGNTDGSPRLPTEDGLRTPEVPPDFPQLRLLLDEVAALRDDVRRRVITDQHRRLEQIRGHHETAGHTELARDASDTMRSLATRDLIAVEDIIIRLQNGQRLALQAQDHEDHFSTFYPGFVNEAATAILKLDALEAAMTNGAAVGPLDYAALDESSRVRSRELWERWRQLQHGMSQQNRGDLRNALRLFMERLDFTSVELERETTLTDRLRWVRMRTDPLVATRWFLPPVFGSEARGAYPVFLARRDVDDAQLMTELAKVGRDSPCILLVFDRMSKSRRENFALAMRRAKQSVLLIDETLVLYLTANTSWMERLFNCASPFGYLQPYTTNPGNISTEMFFGREAEIAKIESATTDGCLVYGGRQLGKSALLHHVRKRFDDKRTGRRAFYLKIDEFGGQVHEAKQIWAEIHRVLAGNDIVPKKYTSPAELCDDISAWLASSGERRLLMLIDEADMFLAAEVRAGFPNLNQLKDLMEATARRFKVVFAGLHNVRRMARAPNSPLVHLSEPICIGPLNTTAESSQQARRLVVEPMRAAGFNYDSQDLVHTLLTRVNYYPSLVQVYCKALLEGISSQPRPPGGPRWTLQRKHLFESSSAQDINSQIRERFQWTLNLDPRYELIAKVIALHRLDGSDLDGGAISADDLAREVEDFWPNGYEKLRRDDLRAFLDEMVDLGVLIRVGGAAQVYALRGAQVAQMLGRREQLEREILEIADKEPRVDYDASQYHRRALIDQLDRRSPLPDSLLASLFDSTRPGVRLVSSTPAIWGRDIARALVDLANGWNDAHGRLAGVEFRGNDSDLRREVDRKSGRRMIGIEIKEAVNPAWLDWLSRHEQVRAGTVMPVFVGTAGQIAPLLSSNRSSVHLFNARPWGLTMLRAWLSETSLAVLDTRECRKAILDISGGVPLLLATLRPELEKMIGSRSRADLVDSIRALRGSVKLTPSDAGLPDRLVPAFLLAADLIGATDGGADCVTLEGLLADEHHEVPKAIEFMEQLGLLVRQSSDTVVLSPFGRLVHTTFTSQSRGGG